MFEEHTGSEAAPKSHERKGWVAGLLSFALPGLGQMYNGQPGKGAAFYVLTELAPALGGLAVMHIPSLLGFWLFMFFGMYAYIIWDAVVTARRIGKEFTPRRYNKPGMYLVVFMVCGMLVGNLFSIFAKAYVVQAYKIPSASNAPTILMGDRLLAEKGFGMEIRPARGEVVVFESPKKPEVDYIKRVIGLPGETVEIRDKKLYIDGVQFDEPYAVFSDDKVIPASEQPRDNMAPVKLADGMYFMLGDNRDGSYDSRYFGPVSGDGIKGVVKAVYWSWDKETGSVRWDRVGMGIK